MTELHEILFNIVYRDGKLTNANYLLFPGQIKNMPTDIREMLDGIQVEDLAILRTVSSYFCHECFPMSQELADIPKPNIYQDIFPEYPLSTVEDIKAECKRKITRMKNGEGIMPTLGDQIYPLIKANLFSVKNGKRKINPSLYASEDEINTWLYPIQEALNNSKKDIESWKEAHRINEIVRMYNPYFKALKTSAEFRNRRIDDLYAIVYDYMSMLYGMKPGERFYISSEIIPPEIFNNRPLLYPCTQKDLQPLLDYARKQFGIGQYYLLPQGKEINKIIHSIGAVEDVITQLDLFGTATIPIDKDFTLVITNYEKPLSPAARKLLDIFLMEYPKQGLSIELSLKEYMEDYTGYTDKNFAKEQLRKILNGKELANIGFEVREKGKPSGHIYLNGGTSAYIKGKAHWNFNIDFQPILEKSFMAEMPKGYLQTNDKWHPNAYYLSRAIWIDWRMNEGIDRPLSVKTLIDKCPPLKKNLNSKKKFEDIQQRFVDDLDSLEDIFVDYIDPTGKIIDDPKSISWDEFYKSSIRVDHSDFPHHPQRLKAKHRKKEQLEKAIAKAQAKEILKKNP